jgi:hypothetical protein
MIFVFTGSSSPDYSDGVTTLSPRARPPWSRPEVESLNLCQKSGRVHPFTCGNDECRGKIHLGSRVDLEAREDGWFCPYCEFTQNWAWSFMTNYEWREPGPWNRVVFTGVHGDIE